MHERTHHEPWQKVSLITGAAQRVGEQLARGLHARGYRVIVHYRNSAQQAQAIVDDLNKNRPLTAVAIAADLADATALVQLAADCLKQWGRIDVLINNASSYYPTPWGEAKLSDWQTLIGSNLMGPFFLTQELLPALTAQCGCVVNMIDIFAERPARDMPIYGMAKAGLAHMTKSLAFDLRGKVRVNGIAPGAILWPEQLMSSEDKSNMLQRIPLGEIGDPSDIVRTALFLIEDAPYINGQIIAVDGGLSLNT
ncbi:MAG: pteridine reductase [Spongiibacteraceae bacterium]